MGAGDRRVRGVSYHIARCMLALLFVYAGGVKLLDMPRFANHVGDFGLVFDPLVTPIAVAICLIELGLGVALLANLPGSLLGIAGLLIGFIGVLLYGIAIGLDIECGCLGTSYRISLRSQLLIDLGLLCWCYLVHWSKSCHSPSQSPAGRNVARNASRTNLATHSSLDD